jgi:ABC-type multidrug transport system fused ATPase/permease subunit
VPDVAASAWLRAALEAHAVKIMLAAFALCLLVIACRRIVAPAVRERIAQGLQSGKLKPDSRGVVKLPSDLAMASIGGQAFTTTNRTAAIWLLCRTWRGKGANLTGYLYAPGQPLKLGSEVEVTTEGAGVIFYTEVTVERSLAGSWYVVHRGYD